jgi:hypothetical protein
MRNQGRNLSHEVGKLKDEGKRVVHLQVITAKMAVVKLSAGCRHGKAVGLRRLSLRVSAYSDW